MQEMEIFDAGWAVWMRVLVAAWLSAVCSAMWLGTAVLFEDAQASYGVSRSALNLVSNMYLGAYCLASPLCAFVVDRAGLRTALLVTSAAQISPAEALKREVDAA